MKRVYALLLFLWAIPVLSQTLSLTQGGSGNTSTVTVTSSGQFVLVWEAADNWGLSQWYDLINDPGMTNSAISPIYSVSGSGNPCNAEPGLANMVFYGETDEKLNYRNAANTCTFAPTTATMTILYNTPQEVVLQTVGPPMTNGARSTDIVGTVTYYIFPNGKIYIRNSVHVTANIDLGCATACDLFLLDMGMEDPTQTGTSPPDTQGFIRATKTTNPWDNNTTTNEPYVFIYWNQSTGSPYTHWTQQNVMAVLSPNNTFANLYEIRHSWSSGTGFGVVRWGYRYSPGPNMTSGQTITNNFLIQLGTSGSSVLPNLTTTTVATPIANAYTATPVISPAQPVVNQGGTVTFAELQGDAGTWSCSGCAGSIGSTTGIYTAPATVNPQQSVGGGQLHPNNHVFNVRVDSLSVNSNSATWIAAASSNPVNYLPSFPVNYANGSTPLVAQIFGFTPANNGNFQIPAYPFVRIENGWLSARTYNPQSVDHHLLVVDTTTNTLQEQYEYYPAGTNGGCPTCTSASGIRYSSMGYLLPQNAATDAAGMELTPLMLRLQEMEQAVATAGTIKHALRMTMNVGACASSNIWPATTFAVDGGTIPFGARFRLKSSFNITGFSTIAKILLTQLQQYGLILSDGGQGWQVEVEYTRWPKAYIDAFKEIQTAAIAKSNWEAVDESGLQISASSGDTNTGERVTFTRTSDSATATMSVALQGVAVNLPSDVLYIQANTAAQQFPAFANIGTVTWTMSPTVGAITSGGLYTPPASVGSPTSTTVTATSTTNAAIAASMTVVIYPTGVIRLAPGQPSNYTDVNSHVWYAGELNGGDGSGQSGCQFGGCGNGGSFPGTPDIALYEIPIYAGNDIRFDISVANGNYQVLAKMMNNSGTNTSQGNLIFEPQGSAGSVIDIWSLVGNNQPDDFTFSVSVSAGLLSFVLREVNTTGNNVAPFISALQITPLGSGGVCAIGSCSGGTSKSGGKLVSGKGQ